MAKPSVKLWAKSAARFRYPDTRRSFVKKQDKKTEGHTYPLELSRCYITSSTHSVHPPVPHLNLVFLPLQGSEVSLAHPSARSLLSFSAMSLLPFLPPLSWASPWKDTLRENRSRSDGDSAFDMSCIRSLLHRKSLQLCGRLGRLTLSAMAMATMCVAVSVSVTVSVSSFHMSHKFLHHEEGDNPTENPQPHRQNGALSWEQRHRSMRRCGCRIPPPGQEVKNWQRQTLPTSRSPFPSLSHHCGSVHVQAAPQRGENEVLQEVEKRGMLGTTHVQLRAIGKSGVTKEKEPHFLLENKSS